MKNGERDLVERSANISLLPALLVVKVATFSIQPALHITGNVLNLLSLLPAALGCRSSRKVECGTEEECEHGSETSIVRQSDSCWSSRRI